MQKQGEKYTKLISSSLENVASTVMERVHTAISVLRYTLRSLLSAYMWMNLVLKLPHTLSKLPICLGSMNHNYSTRHSTNLGTPSPRCKILQLSRTNSILISTIPVYQHGGSLDGLLNQGSVTNLTRLALLVIVLDIRMRRASMLFEKRPWILQVDHPRPGQHRKFLGLSHRSDLDQAISCSYRSIRKNIVVLTIRLQRNNHRAMKARYKSITTPNLVVTTTQMVFGGVTECPNHRAILRSAQGDGSEISSLPLEIAKGSSRDIIRRHSAYLLSRMVSILDVLVRKAVLVFKAFHFVLVSLMILLCIRVNLFHNPMLSFLMSDTHVEIHSRAHSPSHLLFLTSVVVRNHVPVLDRAHARTLPPLWDFDTGSQQAVVTTKGHFG